MILGVVGTIKPWGHKGEKAINHKRVAHEQVQT
jgi:hypothetical protein